MWLYVGGKSVYIAFSGGSVGRLAAGCGRFTKRSSDVRITGYISQCHGRVIAAILSRGRWSNNVPCVGIFEAQASLVCFVVVDIFLLSYVGIVNRPGAGNAYGYSTKKVPRKLLTSCVWLQHPGEVGYFQELLEGP